MTLQIPQATGPPTASQTIRDSVNRFINEQEVAGYKALIFRMDYLSDETLQVPAGINLTDFYRYRFEEDMQRGVQRVPPGNNTTRLAFQNPTLLRISEERMLPLGVWLWEYTEDVLTYLGD